MEFYRKFAPAFMIAGFVLLGLGVFLSVQSQVRLSYTVVVIGLIVYIAGRIGVHISHGKNAKSEREIDEEDEGAQEFDIDEGKRNEIEV